MRTPPDPHSLPQATPPSPDARRDRWTAHRAHRRQEFVAAALRVLTTHGPELPMDAVAAEAGVTKPVLYRYFADKAALVAPLGEYASALLQERLVPALTADGPVLARIRSGVGVYFAIIDGSSSPPLSPQSAATTCTATGRIPARPGPGRSASPAWCRAPGNGGWTGAR